MTTTNNTRLGDILRIVRVAMDLTIKELSSLIGISSGYISEIEKNKKKPTMNVIQKYSEVSGLKMGTILSFDDEAKTSGYHYKKLLIRVLNELLNIDEETENMSYQSEDIDISFKFVIATNQEINELAKNISFRVAHMNELAENINIWIRDNIHKSSENLSKECEHTGKTSIHEIDSDINKLVEYTNMIEKDISIYAENISDINISVVNADIRKLSESISEQYGCIGVSIETIRCIYNNVGKSTEIISKITKDTGKFFENTSNKYKLIGESVEKICNQYESIGKSLKNIFKI